MTEEVQCEEVNHLAFWESVQETNPKHTKEVSFGGRKFNTIDAYYQIMTATSHWGMYGATWGLRKLRYNQIEGTPLFRVSARFYYPDGVFEITTAIKIANNKGVYDDDFAKKVETDLITKSLSRLGFNADVFLGMFDDNKYTQELQDKYTPTYTDMQKKTFDDIIENDDQVGMVVLSLTVDTKVFSDLYNSFGKGQKVRMKQVVDSMIKAGHEMLNGLVDDIVEKIVADDAHGLKEITDELANDERSIIWDRLNHEQQSIAKELLLTIS